MRHRVALTGALTVLGLTLVLAGCNLNVQPNQNSLVITGGVYDDQSLPLQNAQVILAVQGPDSLVTIASTTTDLDGLYGISAARPDTGSAYLYAELSGYQTSAKAEIKHDSSPRLIFNFQLTPSGPPTQQSVAPGERGRGGK